jgi:hypothetical protein
MARVKKAQSGDRVTRMMTDKARKNYNDSLRSKSKSIDPGFFISPKGKFKNPDPKFEVTPKGYDPNKKRRRVFSADGTLEYLKNGGKMNKIQKAQGGKKVRLKEDSRAYITKVKTDDKGNVTSLKSRRTVRGLLTGAPRAKKIMKSGGKTKKK